MIIAATACACGLGSAANYVLPLAARVVQQRTVSNQLALTYDDGPGVELTPRVLDLLGTFGAKATFFALGYKAANGGASILDRAVAEGHEVGCHSQKHLHAWKTLPWRTPADASAGFRALGRWLPERPLFRPPYGKTTLATWLVVRRHGGKVVWWTLDSGDTHAVLPDPQSIVEQMVRERGGVVLMHDFDRSPERAEFVLETTRLLLEAARREGIRCGTMSGLFGGS